MHDISGAIYFLVRIELSSFSFVNHKSLTMHKLLLLCHSYCRHRCVGMKKMEKKKKRVMWRALPVLLAPRMQQIWLCLVFALAVTFLLEQRGRCGGILLPLTAFTATHSEATAPIFSSLPCMHSRACWPSGPARSIKYASRSFLKTRLSFASNILYLPSAPIVQNIFSMSWATIISASEVLADSWVLHSSPCVGKIL